MKKWFKRWQWKLERWWYRVRVWSGLWYCEYCEKMHSPFISKYDFYGNKEYECRKGVYEIDVPKSYQDDPDYYHELVLKLHKVG